VVARREMQNGKVWDVACDLARSGDFANVIMIEKELRRRGLIGEEHVTTNVPKRELLTRLCHAARNGKSNRLETPQSSNVIAVPSRSRSQKAGNFSGGVRS
jgi:hypothetical protein